MELETVINVPCLYSVTPEKTDCDGLKTGTNSVGKMLHVKLFGFRNFICTTTVQAQKL